MPWWPCSLVLHSLLSCSVGTVGVRKFVTLFRSSAFVLLGLWRAFPLPLPTRQIRLHRTATSFFSWHLICLFGWHPTAPTIAGTFTAEWLSSPGGSPRPPPAPAIYSTVANLALGYAVSWYSTTSLAHAKSPKRCRPLPFALLGYSLPL